MELVTYNDYSKLTVLGQLSNITILCMIHYWGDEDAFAVYVVCSNLLVHGDVSHDLVHSLSIKRLF